jgi:hypothetical protein
MGAKSRDHAEEASPTVVRVEPLKETVTPSPSEAVPHTCTETLRWRIMLLLKRLEKDTVARAIGTPAKRRPMRKNRENVLTNMETPRDGWLFRLLQWFYG